MWCIISLCMLQLQQIIQYIKAFFKKNFFTPTWSFAYEICITFSACLYYSEVILVDGPN